MHFDRLTDLALPPTLAALNDQKREVHPGILPGTKAKTISGKLAIAPSTVVTCRKRAYEKLGVSSRAGFFAIFAA